MFDISKWETRAKNIPRWSEPASQQIIDLLVAIFHENLSPTAAAERVGQTHDTGFLWSILCDAIRRLGGSLAISNQIVDLLNSLAILSTEQQQQRRETASSKQPFLPQAWHVTFMDYGIFIVHYDEGIDNQEEFYKQATKLFNATTFAATLLARANFDNDMHFDAFTAMDTALITGYDPKYLDHEYRVMLPPAATWILLAGERIREICLHGFGNMSPAPDLWNVWQRKFLALSISEIDEDCKNLAARAAVRMEEIEKSKLV